MRNALSLIVVALVVVLMMGLEAYNSDFHRSTGMVVKVDPTKRTVLLAKNSHYHELLVGPGDVVLDDRSKAMKALIALQVGDYVSEECIFQKGGPSIARKINVLQPAWIMLESPEYLCRLAGYNPIDTDE